MIVCVPMDLNPFYVGGGTRDQVLRRGPLAAEPFHVHHSESSIKIIAK